jgi:hypothetical protein
VPRAQFSGVVRLRCHATEHQIDQGPANGGASGDDRNGNPPGKDVDELTDQKVRCACSEAERCRVERDQARVEHTGNAVVNHLQPRHVSTGEAGSGQCLAQRGTDRSISKQAEPQRTQRRECDRRQPDGPRVESIGEARQGHPNDLGGTHHGHDLGG